MHAPPFFVVGCPRSGTTMLRDALRDHPQLASPEETHFFRFGEPFGTGAYAQRLIGNDTLQLHRRLDGIGEDEFARLLDSCASKAEFCDAYMRLYMSRRKPEATRWFDKTPQNVYGAALILASFPRARLVHLVRDPLEVAASLRLGRVIRVERLLGACNYWNEAVDTMALLEDAFPQRVMTLRYEDLAADPLVQLRRLLDFVDVPFDAADFQTFRPEARHHPAGSVLSQEECERVRRRCRQGRLRHGYEPRESDQAPSSPATGQQAAS